MNYIPNNYEQCKCYFQKYFNNNSNKLKKIKIDKKETNNKYNSVKDCKFDLNFCLIVSLKINIPQ